MFPIATENIEHVKAIVEAGLNWLYTTEQPDQAITSHHGITSPAVSNTRRYTFVPEGWASYPVLVYNVAKPEYSKGGTLLNPVGGDLEREFLIKVINDLGRQTAGHWNGNANCETGSISLADRAHSSLLAVVGRYRTFSRDCPECGGVLCRVHGWYAEGARHLVTPAWPAYMSASPSPDLEVERS
jgi:hypothetical protein